MCHLLLLLPVLGLPVFWLAPLPVAAPVYGVVVALSVWLYYFVMRSMRRPVETGVERLRRETGEVVEAHGNRASVRVGSELWQASCREALEPGERVAVVGVDALTLRVRKVNESGAGGARSASGPALGRPEASGG